MGIIKFTEKANACFYQTAELEKIAGGYYFTEGPVWDSIEKCLYFTNFQDNTIYRFKEREGTSLYRKESGRAVGLSLAADGRIVSAETSSHAVTFAGETKSEVIAGTYQGKILNSPNDVVVKKDGAVYFTDPYSVAMGGERELDFNGVFCVPVTDGKTDGSRICLIDDRMERPNGIAFSPDEKILYVNDTNKQYIRAYQMRSAEEASLIGTFAELDEAYGAGCADGMKVDEEGNVYLTGPGGIWVIDSSGTPAAILECPENAGNLCFGGEDNCFLYITASTSVYRIPVKIPGIVPRRV